MSKSNSISFVQIEDHVSNIQAYLNALNSLNAISPLDVPERIDMSLTEVIDFIIDYLNSDIDVLKEELSSFKLGGMGSPHAKRS